MNTIDTVISQNDHISVSWARSLAASPMPRSLGMAYEIMVSTIMA
jgi:hypothetical protein